MKSDIGDQFADFRCFFLISSFHFINSFLSFLHIFAFYGKIDFSKNESTNLLYRKNKNKLREIRLYPAHKSGDCKFLYENFTEQMRIKFHNYCIML